MKSILSALVRSGLVFLVASFFLAVGGANAAGLGSWTSAGSPGWSDESRMLTLADGNALLIGFNSSSIYDASSGTWKPAAAYPGVFEAETPVLLTDGRVFVANTTPCNPSGVGAVYDPSLDTWTTTPGAAYSRANSISVVLPNGKVLIAGGIVVLAEGENCEQPITSSEIFDPETGTFTPTGDMLDTVQDYTGQSASLLPNGKVLVTGSPVPNAYTSVPVRAELYDPTAGTWSYAGTEVNAALATRSVVLDDGRVLKMPECGIFLYDDFVCNQSEIYDSTTNQWTATGSFNQRRNNYSVNLSSGGKVLVAGGVVSEFFLTGPVGYQQILLIDTDTAELFDPASGAWTTVSPMQSYRANSISAALGDGSSLIVGGYKGKASLESAGKSLATSERYTP